MKPSRNQKVPLPWQASPLTSKSSKDIAKPVDHQRGTHTKIEVPSVEPVPSRPMQLYPVFPRQVSTGIITQRQAVGFGDDVIDGQNNEITIPRMVDLDSEQTISNKTIENSTISFGGVIPTGSTGTGRLVFDNTPTLITPILGVASVTSINKVVITAPATAATLTILNNKTLTVNNILTLAGTDSTVMTFPATSATIARTDAANTFTGHQTIEGVTTTGATGTGNLVFASSPTITTPTITTPTIADFTNAAHDHQDADDGGQLTGAAISDKTGSGTTVVMSSTPTIVTPTIAQINNSSAPGVALQLRTQTDNSNSIASATTAGLIVQYGWGQLIGSGTASMSETVTFPTTYSTIMGMIVTGGGATDTDSTAATSITDFEVTTNTVATYSSVTTSTASVRLERAGGESFTNTRYWGYAWIAWGVQSIIKI